MVQLHQSGRGCVGCGKRLNLATDLHRITRIVFFVLLVPLLGHAQEDEVVKVKSNLVNIDVIVKDKKGKYISDLKPEDFVVTENGQPQKIEFFDAPLAHAETRKVGEAGVVEPSAPTTAPRNYVSLVLDFQTTDITSLKGVREGAIKYVREKVTDADAVALLTVTHGLQMVQSFTQDKARLIAALENLGPAPDSKNFEQRDIGENISNLRDFLNGAPSAPPGGATNPAAGAAMARVMIAQRVLAQFIQLRTTLSLQQARPVLAALAALARVLPGTACARLLLLTAIARRRPDFICGCTGTIAANMKSIWPPINSVSAGPVPL